MLFADGQVQTLLETASGDSLKLPLDHWIGVAKYQPIMKCSTIWSRRRSLHTVPTSDIAIPLHRGTFLNVMDDATVRDMPTMGLGEPGAVGFMKLVRHHGHVRSLDPSANQISVPFERWNFNTANQRTCCALAF
ncbi:unnamed protein product [Prorocentrum cordatum]|uniref:Uncharacterized protein n=1 Tax=Prorocentrum cordatum TaxID=2364126 RepID=A0ABN9Q0L3_9DINO|nr:unnamed protein product [Polarella glacialis]